MSKIYRNITTGNIVKAKSDIAAALMAQSANYEEVKQEKKTNKKDEGKAE